MTDRGTLPEWPAPVYATSEAALLAALDRSHPGDEVVVHQGGCGTGLDVDCDCTPRVIVVGEARA